MSKQQKHIATSQYYDALSKIHSSVIAVDRAFADTYLNNNTINRPVNNYRVNGYAEQMKSNQWRLNGEPIIISKMGTLLDGQHRLMAVHKTNLSIPMLVIRGIDESTFDTINTGDSRTSSDLLSIEGIPLMTAKALGVAISNDIKMRLTGSISANSELTRKITPHVVLDAHKNTPGYLSATKFIMQNKPKAPPISAGMMSFLLYRFRKIGDQSLDSDTWIAEFMTGSSLVIDDPRLWIRNRITREFTATAKSRTHVRVMWVIKAWHLWSNNKTVGEQNFFRSDTLSFKFINTPTDNIR